MEKKELLENRKRVLEIMNSMAKDPETAVKKLEELRNATENTLNPESLDYHVAMMPICEATGDCMIKLKKISDAEKSFQGMVNHATKLYEADPAKSDFPLGAAYQKLGSFYRALIGCHVLAPKAKELNEAQKKGFELCEQCYKSALACTMPNAKSGNVRYVEFHAACLGDLVVLHSSVGNYEQAILCGKDAVRLNKAVYEKMDDKVHAFRLANQMNGLAAVYMFVKNPQLAMENLEDALFVLEEHEAEDPKTFGPMIARYYISLGSCYCVIEEEKENAEDAYKKGLDRMVALNEQSDNRLIDDVLQSYMFVAEYYAKNGKNTEATEHYNQAMKMASDMWKATKKTKYESLINVIKEKLS